MLCSGDPPGCGDRVLVYPVEFDKANAMVWEEYTRFCYPGPRGYPLHPWHGGKRLEPRPESQPDGEDTDTDDEGCSDPDGEDTDTDDEGSSDPEDVHRETSETKEQRREARKKAERDRLRREFGIVGAVPREADRFRPGSVVLFDREPWAKGHQGHQGHQGPPTLV